MNRLQMRTMLRERIKDKNSDRWTSTELNLELDAAAQDVATWMSQTSNIHFGRSIFAIDTASNVRVYPLYGLSNFHSAIVLLLRSTGLPAGRFINESESASLYARYEGGDGRDEDNLLICYLTYDPNEKVVVTLTGAPTGGTFALTYKAAPTAGIAPTATAADVQAALELLATITAGDVTVTGDDGGPWTLTFAETQGNVELPDFTANGTLLSGGTDPDVTAEAYHYALNFLVEPASVMELDLAYSRVVPAIADADDTHSYSVVPVQYHEHIVARAAAVLLGHDGTNTAGFASALWQKLTEDTGVDSARRTDPFRVSS